MRKKSLVILGCIMLLMIVQGSVSAQTGSWFYKETFDLPLGAQQTEWSNEFYYGRFGTYVSTAEGSSQLINTTIPGKLTFRGTVNTSANDLNGLWVGKNIYNTNHYSASAQRPFGWQIIREMARLDATTTAGNPGDERKRSMVGIAMFVDGMHIYKPLVQNDRTHDTQSFQYYVDFSDQVGCYIMGTPAMRQQIQYYNGNDNDLTASVKAGLSPRGVYVNMSNVLNNTNLYQMYANNPAVSNTNKIGFRMEHDGTYLSLFINPNPYSRISSMPNEWIFVSKEQVLWNNNFQLMIEHAQKCSDNYLGAHRMDATWDNMLIRSAADRSKQGLLTTQMAASTIPTDYKTVSLVLTNTILKQTNAGINYIKFTKPAQYVWPSTFPLTNNHRTNFAVQVRTHYDNNVSTRTLVNVASQTDMTGFFTSANKVMVRTNGNDLYLILSSQITNMSTAAYQNIAVDMKFYVPSVANDTFLTWVQAEQFSGMTASKMSNYSTCGWQQTSGANYISQIKGSSYAYASIGPQNNYVDKSPYNFIYQLSTEGVSGRQDIKYAAVRIPNQFTNCAISGFAYGPMGTNVNHLMRVTRTNIFNGTNIKIIYMDFSGNSISGTNASGVITFNVTGSPVIGTGKWASWVDGSGLSGSSLLTGTNSIYPSQTTIVQSKGPAIAYGSIVNQGSPYKSAQNFPFTYYFSTANVPDGRDRVSQAAILIPNGFTNAKITNFQSVVIGFTNTKNKVKLTNNISGLGTGKFIKIDYSANKIASPNGLDVFSFNVIGNVSAGTSTWKSWVDGSFLASTSSNTRTNTDFTSKAIIISPNEPADGFAEINPRTGNEADSLFTFSYKISTAGVASGHENVKWIGIEIPDIFTNSVLTNFSSANFGTISPSLIKRTNGISGLTVKKVIKLNFTNNPITSPGSFDVISFQAKGSVPKGIGQWRGWVDANSLNALSHPLGTNASCISYTVKIGGETPKVSGEIWKPNSGTPARVLFNTVTMYTLEYKLHNTSSVAGNKIYQAIISLPVMFTNIRTFMPSDKGLPTNCMRVGLGTVTTLTLNYAKNGSYIPSQDYDSVKFLSWHNVPALTTNTASFSAVVNNSNGEMPWPSVNTSDYINLIKIQNPQPVASSCIQPLTTNNIIWTSDRTNQFKYYIKNIAPSGTILAAKITFPALYFTNISAVSSGMATNIVLAGSNIILNYIRGSATNSFGPEDMDTITFKVADKYANNLAVGSAIIPCMISNATTADQIVQTTDLNNPYTRTVTFTPQPARVQSWVSNNYVLTAVSTSTLYYKIRNYGDSGNLISKAVVAFSPTNKISGITSVTSINGHAGSWTLGKSSFSNTVYNLDGGTDDVLKIVVNDIVSNTTSRNLLAAVTVNTSINAQTSLPSGKTKTVYFQIPPPFAQVGISPNVLFTTNGHASAIPVTNHLTVTVYNNGTGSNDLLGVIVYIPAILQGKVTGASAFGTVNNSSTKVAVDYSGSHLLAGDTRVINLVVTNSMTVKSNLSWVIGISNNDGVKIYTSITNVETLAGSMRTTSVVQKPNGYIVTPLSIEDASVTNMITYKLDNLSSLGGAIMGARITVPAGIYTVVPNSINIQKSKSSSSVSGGYIWLNFTNFVDNGDAVTVTYRVVDNISKGTNISIWPLGVKYFTNDGYYTASTNGGFVHLPIVMAPPRANASIIPNYVYTTALTNNLVLSISNTDVASNQISRARIFFPASMNILGVTSSKILSGNIKIGVSCVTMQYKEASQLINGGVKDVVNIQFSHTIPNSTTATLRVMVNNTVNPVNDTSELLASGTTTILSWAPPKARVTSLVPKIDISTYTNRYVFQIDNSSGAAPIQKAVVRFPGTISSVLGVTSSFLTYRSNIKPIAGITTSMTLNYQADPHGPIPKLGITNSDSIIFYAVDNLNYGVGNFQFQCFVNDGTGWVDTITSMGDKKSVAYTNPAVMASGSLDSSTLEIPIYTNNGSKLRTMKYKVINNGLYANSIWYAQIVLPAILTNCTLPSLSSTKGTVSAIRSGTNWLVKVFYTNAAVPLAAGDFDTVTVNMDNFTNRNSQSVGFGCGVCNIPYPAPLTQIDTGARLQIVSTATFRAFAYLDDASTNIYTLDTAASLTYWVYNNSTGAPITNVSINYDPALFSNVQVKSSIPGAITNIAAGVISIRYPLPGIDIAGGTGANFDKLTISFNYHVSHYTDQMMTCSVWLGGTNRTATASAGHSQKQRIQLSTYGRIIGKVFPTSIPVNLELKHTGGAILTTDIFGAPMAALTSDTNGNFVADLVPPGSYDVRFSDRNGVFDSAYYLKNIQVMSNKITDAGTVTLKNAKLIQDKKNEISCWVDTNKSKLILPVGTLGSNVFIDITMNGMSAAQQKALAANTSIIDKDGSDLRVFDFDIRNSSGAAISGAPLNGTGEVVLAYDTAQGWDTSKLAIYFWDDALARWIAIGGTVDTSSRTVSAQVNYVHRVYAVLPAALTESGVIRAVTLAPNPFTPMSTGNNQLKITFMLDKPSSGVKINIFNMKGELVKTFKGFPDNIVNVETWWDGKDEDKYMLPAGVYIYQIRVGTEKYSGSVLLAK